MTYDAIVVGGGVAGISLAYHLVRGGASTLLVDRADPGIHLFDVSRFLNA